MASFKLTLSSIINSLKQSVPCKEIEHRCTNTLDRKRHAAVWIAIMVAVVSFGGGSTVAQDALSEKTKKTKLLQEILQNTALVGHFTIDGKPMSELTQERYEIKKVEPIEDDPTLWTIESRIQYKANDVTLPLVLRVEWADKTPVIVMDRVIVPGLGTFSARVLFTDGKYAGTWAHDGDGKSVGGHLFGKIEKTAKSLSEKESPK